MRKKLNHILTLFIILVSHSLEAKPLIIIDPGHGGKDPGGHYGRYYEKKLALDTALRTERILRSKDYRTVMTRRKDVFPLAST